MTVPQQTNNMTTIFNCADCRKAIKENSREHDDCWTNMEKDDDLWYCGDCKGAHMDEDDEDDAELILALKDAELIIPQAHNIGEFYNEEERRAMFESLKAEFEAKNDDDDDEKEECDCCGENFETVCLTIAEDAEGEEEKYCADCLLLKIDDGCVWQENGMWVC